MEEDMIHESKPIADGFIMPAEFEPHSGCLMLWPFRGDNWRDGAEPARKTFAKVANLIALSERLYMGAREEDIDRAELFLTPDAKTIELDYDDSWMRDIGPTCIKNRKSGEIRTVNWEFNAWGGEKDGLYDSWEKDAGVAGTVSNYLKFDQYKPGVVLEGGAVQVDGQGTLIAVEECVLSGNRNTGMTKERMEEVFRDYLGIRKTIWLPKGVFNDETNGHVDNLCCFTDVGKVLLTWTEDRNDPQYERSANAFEILSRTKDASGNSLMVEKILQPGPLYMKAEESTGVQKGHAVARVKGNRLAASYVNFYIANHAVIVPVFNDINDTAALEKIQSHFPERRIIPVYSREILLGGGNIHCITQQIPK